MSRSSAALKSRDKSTGSANKSASKSPRRESAKQRRLRLQAVEAPGTMSLGLLSIFAILMVFGALLAAALVQTMVVQNQVESDQLADQIEDQKLLQDKLSLEVARLESPDRILHEAQNELGMVTPDNRPYLAPVVPDDPTIAVPVPGEAPFSGTNP